MGNPFYCGARLALQSLPPPSFSSSSSSAFCARRCRAGQAGGREGSDGKGRSPPPLPSLLFPLCVFFAGVSILILPSRWDLVTFAPGFFFLLFIYFPSLPLQSSGAAAGERRAQGGRASDASPPAAAALAGITASPSQLPA